MGEVPRGRGRAKDNIWIERFWKTIKYAYIYIRPEENGADLLFGIKRFIDDYNYHRRYQGINCTVPSKLQNASELKPERVDLFNQLLNLRERYRRVNQYECVIEV